MHTEWITLKRHMMPVNCINSELQNVGGHSGVALYRNAQKKNSLCLCLCLYPVLPSFVCVCTQSEDCYDCSNVNVQSGFLFIILTRKKEEEAEKNVKKGKQERRK